MLTFITNKWLAFESCSRGSRVFWNIFSSFSPSLLQILVDLEDQEGLEVPGTSHRKHKMCLWKMKEIKLVFFKYTSTIITDILTGGPGAPSLPGGPGGPNATGPLAPSATEVPGRPGGPGGPGRPGGPRAPWIIKQWWQFVQAWGGKWFQFTNLKRTRIFSISGNPEPSM